MKRVVFGVAALTMCVGFVAAVRGQSAGKPTLGAWGVDLSGMDKTVQPGDDFFEYANGTWYKNAVIPPDRTSTGSFQDLQILSEKRMKDLVAALEAKPEAQLSAEERKIRDLYDAFTDTTQIEQRGLAPAKKDLDLIASAKTAEDVAHLMGSTTVLADSLFGSFVNADARHPSQYVMLVTQAGLGMPNRDYYLKDDPALAATRDAYRTFLTSMLTLAGEKDAGPRAAAVLALETEIAKAHWTPVERRDADKTYNPMTVAQLTTYAPGFPWTVFFQEQGLSAKGPAGDRLVIVRENTAFPELARIFAATPVPVWRDYLTAHYLHAVSPYLPKAFDDADFEFYGKVLGGETEKLPRTTRAVHLIDQRLGHPLGKLYVAKYFPPQSKAKVEALVANLLKAYDADIRKIGWMTDATKQKALEKLHQFTPHVGYPDTWRDYSGLTIRRDDLIGDIERSNDFEWHYRLDRIDRPVDRNEWGMTPPTINAYYTPVLNSIFFPAAILQAPFFDPNADDAVNYGAIGAVMGHEIGHGFDDQGSKYHRPRRAPELVDRCGSEGVRGARHEARRAVRRLRGAAGPPREREADDGREHRRPVRPLDRATGVPLLAERQAGAGARRLQRRSAVLPRLRADLAREVSGEGDAPADPGQSAQPAALARRRADPQHRCVVRRVRREAGREVPTCRPTSACGSGSDGYSFVATGYLSFGNRDPATFGQRSWRASRWSAQARPARSPSAP